MKLFKPSNGTEGMIFMENWCDRCVHDKPEIEEYCDILTDSVIGAKVTPEWIYKDGKPTCTRFLAQDSPTAGYDDSRQIKLGDA